ncbi:MAG: hypothetical protein ACE5IY_23895 [bacterium]
MHFIKHVLLTFIVSVFVFAGCDGNGNPAGSGGSGGADFTVNVSSGTTPEYSWSAGKAFSVSVVRTSAPTTIVWGLATPGQDNIASPAAHGATPAGAIQTSASETTLTEGVEYRVSVSLLDGKTGFTEFTP